MHAVLLGNAESTALLLQAGAAPNLIDHTNINALAYALSTHPLESAAPLIKLLLAAGADPNTLYTGDSILLGTIRKVFEQPLEDNLEPALEIVKDLLAHGANPNFQNSFFDGNTALILAAWTPLPMNAIMEALIKAGANINQSSLSGVTPLMAAIPNNDPYNPSGNMENVKVLLGHADELDINARDFFEYSALAKAISVNNFEAVQALLEAGANPTLITSIGTPLELAVGKENIIELLNQYIYKAK